MKYSIELEVDGVDNFTTVMKVVEGCRGIRVLSASMKEAKPEKGDRRFYRHTRKNGVHMENLFLEHCKNKSVKEFNLNWLYAWCQDNNYAETSGRAIISKLRNMEKIKNIDASTYAILKY